jgi:SAM-dependent methyltransferase
MMPATYDGTFFEYVNAGAARSARHLLPPLAQNIPIRSVLDVGCGQGVWLSEWLRQGAADIQGIDGDYVDRSNLWIQADRFRGHDLAKSFDLGRRFDLVQSLEVAEHLPPECAPRFIESLVRHGDLILFSAAAKGQGGDHHINEQSYDYWRALFAHHGYIPLDFLRPLVLADARIEPWYRYNTLLYAAPQRFALLPESIQRSRVPDGQKIRDLSPLLYKARKAVVTLLPVSLATRIAKFKERHIVSHEKRSPGEHHGVR